jgi:hypothetical protein
MVRRSLQRTADDGKWASPQNVASRTNSSQAYAIACVTAREAMLTELALPL